MQGRSAGILEYGAIKNLIEMAINNIKNIGIDTSSYEAKFLSIEKEVERKLVLAKECSEEDMSNNINKVYSYGIDKLNLFLAELNKSKVFFQTLNKCMYVFDAQDINVLSEEELSNLVDDAINSLDIIKSSSDFTQDQDIIEKLYELIFNIIKMEYRTNGSSKLVKHCKKDRIDTIYISKYVMKDIEEIRQSNFDVRDIDSLVKKLNSSDNDTLYLNDEILSMISFIKDSEAYTNELLSTLELLSKSLISNNREIERLNYEENKLDEEKNRHKKEIVRKKSWNRQNIGKPVFILGVTLTALTGLITAGIEYGKGTEYLTEVETYTSDTGSKDEKEEYRSELRNNGETTTSLTTINVYEPWVKNEKDDNYKRVIKTVDISGVEYEDLKQYLDLNFEGMGYKYSESSETKELLTLEDLYTDNIKEVIKQEQDTSISQDGKIDFNKTPELFIFGTWAIVLYAYIVGQAFKNDWTFGIIQSIRKIVEEIESRYSFDYEKRELINISKKLIEIKKQIDDLISTNEESKNKYNEIMKKPGNKKILDKCEDSVILLQEYASLSEESDKLILSRNKKEKK